MALNTTSFPACVLLLASLVFSCDKVADRIMEKRAEERGYAEEYKELKEGGTDSGKFKGKPAPISARSTMKLVVTPEQDTVAPGTRFEATVSVENLPDGVIPQYVGASLLANEHTDKGRTATYSVSAPVGFESGTTEKLQQFFIKARISMEDGTIVELEHTGSYTIRKSDVILKPAPPEVLYAECGNPIHVQVPSMGELFNPVYTASEAAILTSPSDKQKITVVPRPPQTTLGVSSLTNGQQIKLTSVTYVVIQPPPPQLEISTASGKLKEGGKLPKSGSAKVKLITHSDFQKKLPKDARYAVQTISLEVTEDGKSRVVAKVNCSGKSGQTGIDLPLDKLGTVKSGSEVRIVLERVSRLNFQNKPIDEKGSFVWKGQVK
jgi:GldM C-terminal domain